MAGVLNFQQYIGGPDQVKVEQVFPSDQKTLIYNFDRDTTGWTVTADYQTIVVDRVSFNRSTGQPNFSDSTVIGSFAKAELTGNAAPVAANVTAGTYYVYFPSTMYTGPIIPDARKNVPITVLAVTWRDANTPAQVSSHRWALIQCWEPDVEVGDPTLATGYTALVVGA